MKTTLIEWLLLAGMALGFGWFMANLFIQLLANGGY